MPNPYKLINQWRKPSTVPTTMTGTVDGILAEAVLLVLYTGLVAHFWILWIRIILAAITY
jgi:predicted membrane-bound dolichyl-phosphate-mannose-protein mannosyltransferase